MLPPASAALTAHATSSAPISPRRIVVLGSTGSIGTQTLDVVRRLGPHRAEIVALAARRNVGLLAEQARATGATYVAVTDEAYGPELEAALAGTVALRAGWGEDTMTALATLPEADTVVVAVAGAVGLRATLAAIEAGKGSVSPPKRCWSRRVT